MNFEIQSQSIGSIVALWRYPVKSMGAESLEEVDIAWYGLVGDRRWAFVRGGVERSGFPWLTIREKLDMPHYVPRFLEPDNPDKSSVQVRTPLGFDFDVVDPALAAELGHDARVIKQSRGIFDTFPLSLITTRTVADLGALIGDELDVQRFRPNLLVEATTEDAFPEDAWVGAVLQIGSARMRIDKRDERCAVVNVDPRTAESDPAVLRTIADARETCLGVYGSTVQPGRITVGDTVQILAVG